MLRKNLSNEQKMKRDILSLKVIGISCMFFAVIFYMMGTRLLPSEGRHVAWIQAAALLALPLIFIFGALVGSALARIVRLLWAEVSECRAQIQLLMDQISAPEGRGCNNRLLCQRFGEEDDEDSVGRYDLRTWESRKREILETLSLYSTPV